MPTTTERRALLFLGAVACLGSGVRVVRAREVPPPTAQERRAIEAQVRLVDSTRRAVAEKRRAGIRGKKDTAAKMPRVVGISPQITLTERRARPDSTHRVDVDQASVTDLQSLPGIGPVLAARIIANRDSAGAFGSMAGLERVSGVGPAIAKRIGPLVSFSGTARDPSLDKTGPLNFRVPTHKPKPSRPP